MALSDILPETPCARLRERPLAALTGEATMIPLFHLLREAAHQRARGFTARFTGLTEGGPHGLLLEGDGMRPSWPARPSRPRKAALCRAATGAR
ncbi:MAG: hypothetical protein JWP20_132 [Roseomonas sp.]|nr:hypothetical protein [Roseomonas sp.]